MSNCPKIAFFFLALLAVGTARADEITNGVTTLRVQVQNGRANAFELIEAKSNRLLSKIELGTGGRWSAACSAKPEGRGGTLAFTSLDTVSTISVELHESQPFPLLRFRLNAAPALLAIRMDSAQVFYRGGLEIPASSETPPVPMSACPVPAAGLWDPASAIFVGIESQEARSSDKSDKAVASACCAAPPNAKGRFLALSLPPHEAETRLRLIYSTNLPASASPNEFVLRHIWRTYQDRLPPVPRFNDLGWLPAREGFVEASPRSFSYRSLAIYTGDPDPADNLDPTFLIQSGPDRLSCGTVSWKGTDQFIRDMALAYVETGDPILRYFLQGALQRWPLGYEPDGLHTIESLDVSGLGRVTQGRRLGLMEPSDALAEYLQPIGPARLRVLCGNKQALAFTLAAPLDIADYRCDENGFGFKVVGDFSSPFDMNITFPLRDLRAKQVSLNGNPVEADAVGPRGENIVLKNVKVGDLVTAGHPESAPLVAEQPPPPPTPPSEWNGYQTVDIPYDTPLDTSWENGLSGAGLVDGLHFAWGVPFRIASGAKPAVDLSKRPLSLNMNRKLGSAFLFTAPPQGPLALVATYADGKTEKHDLTSRYPAILSPPLRRWRIEIFPLKLSRPSVEVVRLDISGRTQLFALTVHPSASPDADAALAVAQAQERAVEKEVRDAKERLLAQERIVPDLREKVAAATRGKLLRIAFLPPFGPGADVLRSACTLLGSPPAMLSPNAVIDPKEFTPDRYPIAVYSVYENFLHTVKQPGDAAEALKRYVASGGCLVAAAHGFPLFYPMRIEGDKADSIRYVKIKGAPPGQVCSALEIFIGRQPEPKPDEMLRYELLPGQNAFSHLPGRLRYDAAAGGPYRPITKEGLPPEDVFRPIMALKDGAGNARDLVAAEIQHNCKRYKGGKVLFLWGNMLTTEIGQTLALDLISYAICTATLKPGPVREPSIALLPQDTAGHDKAIERACAPLGLKPRTLTPHDFADPAIFNPRNFPLAIHAVEDEYYLDELAGRTDLAQTYIDYVKGGGFLVACGNMFQFYYARTLLPDGKSRQTPDPDLLIPTALGLQVSNPKFTDSRPMFLRLAPGQNIITFKSPMPLKAIHWSRYRAANPAETPETAFLPIADICDDRGESFGGYVIALVRFKAKELRTAEALWFWGNLLDDPATHPLLDQAMKYAFDRRKSSLHPARNP